MNDFSESVNELLFAGDVTKMYIFFLSEARSRDVPASLPLLAAKRALGGKREENQGNYTVEVSVPPANTHWRSQASDGDII